MFQKLDLKLAPHRSLLKESLDFESAFITVFRNILAVAKLPGYFRNAEYLARHPRPSMTEKVGNLGGSKSHGFSIWMGKMNLQ